MCYDLILDKIFFKNNKYDISSCNKYNFNKRKKYQNIQLYILNRFKDSKSERETLYRIHYHIEITPKCPICGKPLKFHGRNGKIFLSHCSNKCKKLDKDVNEKWKQSCGPNITNREKAKLTMIEKYGVENPYQIPEIIDKVKHINKEKMCESLEKQKQTNLRKYGVEFYLQSDEFKQKSKQKSLAKYGVDHPMKSNLVKSKLDYKEISRKIIQTKEINQTFNTSLVEEDSYLLLRKKYPDVIRQYKCDRYPYLCDFYIPSLDLFIECQYGWQHGNHPFNINYKEDFDRLEMMRKKNTKYYQNVIYNWTIRDVEKRNTAIRNNLNFIEFWNIEEFKKWLEMPLYLTLDWNKILYEYNYYKSKPGNLKGATSFNYIIKYYQQNIFYKQENELIKDPSIEEKLISNRCRYLNKSIIELTHNDLLLGFKRSGIYIGYSHFNPFIFKYFIEKYDVKKCYDPCGGWGHRLLGAFDLEKYIYNDLSKSTYNNVKRIIHDLKIQNTVTYNNDAQNFIPNEDFDAMFTCPPYYNLESYECGDFKSYEDYEKFIDSLFEVFYNKESCKIFGIVIREDYLNIKYKDRCFEYFEIENKKSKHLGLSIVHNKKEYLYVFIK